MHTTPEKIPSDKKLFRHRRNIVLPAVALTALLGFSACNDSDSSGNGNDGWIAGVFRDSEDFINRCQDPRAGIDPRTNQAYPDMQGSTLNENNWLRSMSNETYLWYNEIVDRNPALFSTPEYFDQLVTNGTTPSGAPKDQFHFTVDSQEYFEQAQQGVSAGYGTNFAILQGQPGFDCDVNDESTQRRDVRVVYSEPGGPAHNAGLNRGAQILSVDGVDLLCGNDVDTLNAGLFPADEGESHTFEVEHLGGTTETITLTSDQVTSVPVQNEQVLAGDVGYLTFNDHIAPAEEALVDAINQLIADSSDGVVDDLVLDIRYNGGGFLAIASQLAYMVAGPNNTQGKIFEEIRFNDKHPDIDPVTGNPLQPTPFIDTTVGFSTTGGQPLPTLNLGRVFVLTGPNTCSASESIINGLRGADVEVYLFGTITCGKPYGFYEMPNCGTSYFTIQFEGANHKGFSGFADGFGPENSTANAGELIPGCQVPDDFEHLLGDPLEAKLAAALDYREQLNTLDPSITPTCPATSSTSSGLSASLAPGAVDPGAVDVYVDKPRALEGKILR